MLYYHLLLFLNKHEKVRVRMDGVGGANDDNNEEVTVKKSEAQSSQLETNFL